MRIENTATISRSNLQRTVANASTKTGKGVWCSAEKTAFGNNNTVENESPSDSKSFKTSIGANAPDSVKDAWDKAAKVAGVDGMGLTADGDPSHVGKMFALFVAESVVERYNFYQKYGAYPPANYASITRGLGDTVQSAKEFTQKCLNELLHPTPGSWSAATPSQRGNEEAFYKEFLANLNKITDQ